MRPRMFKVVTAESSRRDKAHLDDVSARLEQATRELYKLQRRAIETRDRHVPEYGAEHPSHPFTCSECKVQYWPCPAWNELSQVLNPYHKWQDPIKLNL